MYLLDAKRIINLLGKCYFSFNLTSIVNFTEETFNIFLLFSIQLCKKYSISIQSVASDFSYYDEKVLFFTKKQLV